MPSGARTYINKKDRFEAVACRRRRLFGPVPAGLPVKTDLKEPSPFGDLSNVLSALENKSHLSPEKARTRRGYTATIRFACTDVSYYVINYVGHRRMKRSAVRALASVFTCLPPTGPPSHTSFRDGAFECTWAPLHHNAVCFRMIR